MAEIKISQLPEAVDISISGDKSPTKNDMFMIIQNGANKKISWNTMLSKLNRPVIVNSNMSNIPFTVRGNGLPSLLSVVSATNKIGIKVSDPQEELHVEGNVKVGSSSTSGLFIGSNDNIIFTAAPSSGEIGTSINPAIVSGSSEISTLVPKSACYFSLGAGKKGQMKKICYGNSDGSNTCIILVSQGVGFNRITLQTKGSSVVLMYTDQDSSNSGWFVTGYYGSVTFTTV